MNPKEKTGIVKKNVPIFNAGVVIGNIFVSFDMNVEVGNEAILNVEGMVEGVYKGNDFYDAFLALRKFVEKNHEAILGCKGCLKQVHLSGLSRDWSNGLTGYLTNEKTLENESAFIFDEIDIDQAKDLMTIVEQWKYRENFRIENQARYIERNKKADRVAKAKDKQDVESGNSWRS